MVRSHESVRESVVNACRRIQSHQGTFGPLRREESYRHTDHRVRFLRPGGWSCSCWPTPCLRVCQMESRQSARTMLTMYQVHDFQLRHAGHRSGHQLGCENSLHVWRYPALPNCIPRAQWFRRWCRSSTFTRLLCLVWQYSRSQGCCSMER